jgi:acetoacetyl-CoA synthetase
MLSAMPTDTELLAGRDYGDTLWTPDAATIDQARITRYARWLAAERNVLTDGYQQLWQWSVAEPGPFWASIWDYFGVLGERGEGPWLSGGQMPDVTWFGGTTINYARNMLRHAHSAPERTAVIYDSEAGRAGQISYAELERQVARVQAGLAALGVSRGDRVAAYLPNCPEALVALLATASLGAIWSSC